MSAIAWFAIGFLCGVGASIFVLIVDTVGPLWPEEH